MVLVASAHVSAKAQKPSRVRSKANCRCDGVYHLVEQLPHHPSLLASTFRFARLSYVCTPSFPPGLACIVMCAHRSTYIRVLATLDPIPIVLVKDR